MHYYHYHSVNWLMMMSINVYHIDNLDFVYSYNMLMVACKAQLNLFKKLCDVSIEVFIVMIFR